MTALAVETKTPYTVTRGRSPIWVMDEKDVSTNFSLLATRASQKVCIRIAGGCSGMNDADKTEMASYFVTAFKGFGGMIWSGATRQVNAEGETDLMVTEIPGLVAQDNPDSGLIALGTAPRTGIMHLVGESRLTLDEDGTLPNPNLTGMAIIQRGCDGILDWDGDVDMYFDMMDRLNKYGGFEAVGLVSWNGGGTTAKEIMKSLKKKWPTILVKGSGRKTDDIAAAFENGDGQLLSELPEGHKLTIVDRADPASLRTALMQFGFLRTH